MRLKAKTLAVVVSYNGGDSTIRSINALLDIVDAVLIIDNGSEPKSLTLLKGIKNKAKLIELGNNFGIGHALNIGISYAIENKYEWILTMDQDTRVDSNLLKNYEQYLSFNHDVEFMAPTIWNHGIKPKPTRLKFLNYAITSGNLINLNLIKRLGGYNEMLFIDGVDFDFCLRARMTGAKIHLVNDAVIYHELGLPHHHKQNFFSKFYSSHPPIRRYYIYRNYVYLLKNFGTKFPFFAIKTTLAHILMFAAIWKYESIASAQISSKHIYQGLLDAFKNKYGPYLHQ